MLQEYHLCPHSWFYEKKDHSMSKRGVKEDFGINWQNGRHQQRRWHCSLLLPSCVSIFILLYFYGPFQRLCIIFMILHSRHASQTLFVNPLNLFLKQRVCHVIPFFRWADIAREHHHQQASPSGKIRLRFFFCLEHSFHTLCVYTLLLRRRRSLSKAVLNTFIASECASRNCSIDLFMCIPSSWLTSYSWRSICLNFIHSACHLKHAFLVVYLSARFSFIGFTHSLRVIYMFYIPITKNSRGSACSYTDIYGCCTRSL